MTKSELINRVADRFPHLLKQDAQVSIELILDSLTTGLSLGRRAEIRGFGSFTLHHRPTRQGRNPKTGESLVVPAKAAPHFKAGAPLQDFLQSAGQQKITTS